MALINDEFEFNNPKPNFKRDRYATISEMKAVTLTMVDRGHLSFCEETGKRYEFANDLDANKDPIFDSTTGYWRIENSRETPITWSELKTLRDTKMLIAGMLYRITDYACTTLKTGTVSAGHQFDIIVMATSSSTLSEDAQACHHDGDTYFANCRLSEWKLRYCLDNDATHFAWADATNGKGVIYYMKDEWNNECPCDFKNIQYLRGYDSNTELHSIIYDASKTDVTWLPCYTFSSATSESTTEVTDTSLDGNTNKVYNNSMKEVHSYGNKTLGTNCLFGVSIYDCYFDIDSFKNTVGGNCFFLKFGKYSYINVICKNSYYIRIGNYSGNISIKSSSYFIDIKSGCSNISIGSSGRFITIGYSSYSNTLGNSTMYIAMGGNNHNNVIGDKSADIKMGDSTSSTTVGSSCTSVIIASNTSKNTIGNSCYAIKLGEGCYSNTIGDNCKEITLSLGCYNNVFGNNCTNDFLDTSCRDNNFGESFNQNQLGTCCFDITTALNTFGCVFHPCCSNITITATNVDCCVFNQCVEYISLGTDYTISNNTKIVNLEICASASGTSDSIKEIKIPQDELGTFHNAKIIYE